MKLEQIFKCVKQRVDRKSYDISLTVAKSQSLLSGFLCVSFPNGEKNGKKKSKQLWRWWCPSRGRDPCQCFPFGGSRKTGFQCVDFEIISELFHQFQSHLNLKMNWDVRCPKLYQLLNGSKVLRVSPARPGKKNTGSEGCVEARKDFVCWKYTSRKLRWLAGKSPSSIRDTPTQISCFFSIVMFSGVYDYKRVPKMEKDVIVY